MNRLAATPRDNRGALTIVLDHLHDTNTDEFNAAIDMLKDRVLNGCHVIDAVEAFPVDGVPALVHPASSSAVSRSCAHQAPARNPS